MLAIFMHRKYNLKTILQNKVTVGHVNIAVGGAVLTCRSKCQFHLICFQEAEHLYDYYR